MAKFRKNHSKQKSSNTTTIRIVGFIIIVSGVLFFLYNMMTNTTIDWKETNTNTPTFSEELVEGVEKNFLPISTTGLVIEHKHYTLSYSEKDEQAEWVAYKLTKEGLRLPNVKRAKNFKPDYAIDTRSAFHRDYTNSGYTRGHMAPAGDMAFDEEAMQESFFMSNISPQKRAFNGGIWRELEESVRDWAFDNDEVYVVTGPVLGENQILKKIGQNNVSVPKLFYKIVLDNYGPKKKAIAFIMPNEKSVKHISEYIVTIDEVEQITGLDFFADFLDSELESRLESQSNLDQWRISKKRFNKRLNSWNNN